MNPLAGVQQKASSREGHQEREANGEPFVLRDLQASITVPLKGWAAV